MNKEVCHLGLSLKYPKVGNTPLAFMAMKPFWGYGFRNHGMQWFFEVLFPFFGQTLSEVNRLDA